MGIATHLIGFASAAVLTAGCAVLLVPEQPRDRAAEAEAAFYRGGGFLLILPDRRRPGWVYAWKQYGDGSRELVAHGRDPRDGGSLLRLAWSTGQDSGR